MSDDAVFESVRAVVAAGEYLDNIPGIDIDEVDPGLLLSAAHTAYNLKVRWYTRLDEDNCFARWLLIPVHANDWTTI